MSIYNEVSFIIKFLPTLSHGQTSVERGLSNSNSIPKTNMSAETVTTKWLTDDHLASKQLKQYSVEVMEPMMKAFQKVHFKICTNHTHKKRKRKLS